MASASLEHALAALPEWLRLVHEKVTGLRYGVVQVVVHDHQVTQIERTDKTRLDVSPSSGLRRQGE